MYSASLPILILIGPFSRLNAQALPISPLVSYWTGLSNENGNLMYIFVS